MSDRLVVRVLSLENGFIRMRARFFVKTTHQRFVEAPGCEEQLCKNCGRILIDVFICNVWQIAFDWMSIVPSLQKI